MVIPRIDAHVPELMAFIHDLSDAVEQLVVTDADALERRVLAFFTPERMAHIETVAPGWCAMASYADGKTLVHIVTALVALYQLPEFQAAPLDQQTLACWIVFYHDVGKVLLPDARDHTHAFRSAVIAGKMLPEVGFPVTAEYAEYFPVWAELTANAMNTCPDGPQLCQDNSQLPVILSGIDRLFGWRTPAALVVQAVLLHMSINNLTQWPQAAPLTDDEIVRYVCMPLYPLLRLMMLADSDAWSLFNPDIRRHDRDETLEVFAYVEELIGLLL